MPNRAENRTAIKKLQKKGDFNRQSHHKMKTRDGVKKEPYQDKFLNIKWPSEKRGIK